MTDELSDVVFNVWIGDDELSDVVFIVCIGDWWSKWCCI